MMNWNIYGPGLGKRLPGRRILYFLYFFSFIMEMSNISL